jgi:hypothetical protein
MSTESNEFSSKQLPNDISTGSRGSMPLATSDELLALVTASVDPAEIPEFRDERFGHAKATASMLRQAADHLTEDQQLNLELLALVTHSFPSDSW